MEISKNWAGVVLMGGQSTRMGTDKTVLMMDDLPMYQGAAAKLSLFCDEVYYSINSRQKQTHSFNHQTIPDLYNEEGPIGGLVSSYTVLQKKILVFACDMPMIMPEDIHLLLSLHRVENGCSMFYNFKKNYYDPLLSAWEPPMLDKLVLFFEEGGRSLQKFLTVNDIQKLNCSVDARFNNVNTPQDYTRFLRDKKLL